jgi:hypothetical protein
MASTSSGQLGVNSMLLFAEIIRLEFPSTLAPRSHPGMQPLPILRDDALPCELQSAAPDNLVVDPQVVPLS